LASKIARGLFTTGTQSGQNIVPYRALTVKTNETTAMLLISAASYTHRMDTELVKEMTVLLFYMLSAGDWKTFLRLNNIMADGSQQDGCDKQPGAMRKIDGIYNHIFLLLLCSLPPRSFYFHLLSTYELITTLPLAIFCPIVSSNTLYISVHHQ
jgi:hypothetical protein